MNTQIQFNSIPDIRREMIRILDVEIVDDVNMLIRARRENIPISYSDIYNEISRFEQMIAYHRKKIMEEENASN